MKIGEMFPSRWLKADDLGDEDMVVTIKSVDAEEVGQGRDAEQKPVVYFRETDKGLVLNKTNAGTIVGLFGDDTEEWEGKKITLFATEVDFQGKQVLSIRVRKRAPKPAARAREAVAAAVGGRGSAGDEDDDPDPFVK